MWPVLRWPGCPDPLVLKADSLVVRGIQFMRCSASNDARRKPRLKGGVRSYLEGSSVSSRRAKDLITTCKKHAARILAAQVSGYAFE